MSTDIAQPRAEEIIARIVELQPARGEQPGHLGGEPWTSTHRRRGRSFIHERA